MQAQWKSDEVLNRKEKGKMGAKRIVLKGEAGKN